MEVDECKKAAEFISNCDFLLFTCGAGWSADSGLPVYKDIGNVPAYVSRGLTYYDVCQPNWIKDEPELFYGFWGNCMNSYRDAKLHLGYDIIKSWKERSNIQNSSWKGDHQKRIQEKMEASKQKEDLVSYSTIQATDPPRF